MMTRAQSLLKAALILTSSISATDRYQRLLQCLLDLLPCDAACLFEKEGEELQVLALVGLDPEIKVRSFLLRDHPRLKIITEAKAPVVFPSNSELPDPFDGFLEHDSTASLEVHSCLGCPLIVEDEVVGLLTADALASHQFQGVDFELLKMLAALGGAILRTSKLLEQIENQAHEKIRLTQSLVHEANEQKNMPLLGVSPAIDEVRKQIEIVASSDLSILILGETGTGKEVVARNIHARSKRGHAPLIYVNCAALPESIAESELFGHKRGSFTGAHSDRIGKFQLAEGGTLFLDEIGELPLSLQPKLLRVLQEGEIQRVGSDQVLRVNVRVLAATNRDLEKEVKNGRFRADLYHRLNVYPLQIPPLRERIEDITILGSYYADIFQKKYGTAPVRLDPNAKEILRAYDWPGNVRELKNLIARAILTAHHRKGNLGVLLLTASDFEILKSTSFSSSFSGPLSVSLSDSQSNSQSDSLSNSHLDSSSGFSLRKRPSSFPQSTLLPQVSLKEATQDFQKEIILETLKRNKNNWSQTAKALGMDRSNLHHLAKRLGLKISQ